MGGPILPNRTFFFFGYEAMRDRTSRARSLNSPTTNERRGDFSQDGVLLGRDIFDPFNVMEGRRVRFPNNTIPHDRFNPVTQNIMNSMFAPPLPNQPPGVFPNFFWSEKRTEDRNKVSLRIDHNFEEGSRLWGRWTWQKSPNEQDINVPGVRRAFDFQHGQQTVVGWTKQFGASVTTVANFPQLTGEAFGAQVRFDTRCFSINPTDYGNSVVNPIFRDGIVNLDFGMINCFSFWESRYLEFRADAFNLLTNVNLGGPSGSVTSGSFGRVSSAAMARQIQLALRIVF